MIEEDFINKIAYTHYLDETMKKQDELIEITEKYLKLIKRLSKIIED